MQEGKNITHAIGREFFYSRRVGSPVKDANLSLPGQFIKGGDVND